MDLQTEECVSRVVRGLKRRDRDTAEYAALRYLAGDRDSIDEASGGRFSQQQRMLVRFARFIDSVR